MTLPRNARMDASTTVAGADRRAVNDLGMRLVLISNGLLIRDVIVNRPSLHLMPMDDFGYFPLDPALRFLPGKSRRERNALGAPDSGGGGTSASVHKYGQHRERRCAAPARRATETYCEVRRKERPTPVRTALPGVPPARDEGHNAAGADAAALECDCIYELRH